MPELPEVETIARRLRQVILDKKISRVDVRRDKSFQGDLAQVIGTTITSVTRKAKVLRLELSSGVSLLIHLKMTGQLIYDESGKRVGGGHPTDDWVESLPSKHTRVVLDFEQPGTLYFNDMRVFGWIKVVTLEEVEKEMASYAPDITDSQISPKYLVKVFSRRTQPIKQVIMDNAIVAGIGNIYANDALNLAKINPLRPAKSLTKKEVQSLYEAAVAVITKGIELGGATIDNYRNVDGMAGGYQDVVRVYQKEGGSCPNCGSKIIRIKQGGRSTFYCPSCQI